jgi:hypothetical protein
LTVRVQRSVDERIEISSDSGSKKCRRGCGGAYVEVWRSLHFVAVCNKLCYCSAEKVSFLPTLTCHTTLVIVTNVRTMYICFDSVQYFIISPFLPILAFECCTLSLSRSLLLLLCHLPSAHTHTHVVPPVCCLPHLLRISIVFILFELSKILITFRAVEHCCSVSPF